MQFFPISSVMLKKSSSECSVYDCGNFLTMPRDLKKIAILRQRPRVLMVV